jgi:ribosomal-protein-alanine N-acetyltransferase
MEVRWLIRRDLAEVLDIERASFEFAWAEEEFLTCLRQRNCIGMVAEHQNQIFGFMLYELHRHSIHVLNFAVHPNCLRQGIGAQMVAKLIEKLSQQRREEIVLEVRETNLDAQLFFQSQNFRAVSVMRDWYDNGEDAYVMRYLIREAFTPANRMAKHFDSRK